MTAPPALSSAARFAFAFACFFRVLFDGAFAGRAFAVRDAMPSLPPPSEPKPAPEPRPASTPVVEPKPAPPSLDAALVLLGVLQREGRLVDFLEQDVATFSDADVGAAARVVHEGCRKALRAHVDVAPVRSDDEGARVRVAPGYDASEVKLVGNVSGKGPYEGVLAHRGWKVTKVELPTLAAGHDPRVLAPAEVEIA